MQNVENLEIISPSVDFINDLSRFTCEIARTTEGKELPEDVALSGIRALFENPDYGIFILATLNGQAVGSINLFYEYNAQLAKRIYWIQNVYVEPEHRSKGIFRLLYDEAMNKARQEGCPCIKLYADKTNLKAQRVYEKLGMRNSKQMIYERDFHFGDDATFSVSKEDLQKSFQAEKFTPAILNELAHFKSVHMLGNIGADDLNFEGLKLSESKSVSEVYVIRKNGKVVGIASIFSEWSDWRCKLLHWIYDIKIAADVDKKEYPQYLKAFLTSIYEQLDKENMGALRVNFIKAEPQLIDALKDFGLEESHYYIFETPTPYQPKL